MSNARASSRRNQGQRPGSTGQPSNGLVAAQPQNPMGFSPFGRKEKDDLRSKIMKAKSRYEDLCDVVDGQRFRVRAEILDNSEDYITVQMGCRLEGVIDLPWAEYSSADLEIRYGSQLDLTRKVKMMIRRSVERLGVQLDVNQALRLRGSDEETHLLMSNKEWKSLLERQPSKLARPQRPAAPVAVPPVVNGGTGYYTQTSDAARAEMERKFQQLFPGDQGSAPKWADSNEPAGSSSLQSSVAIPPPTQQRGISASGEVAHGRTQSTSSALGQGGTSPPRIPAPKGAAPFIPAPTTNR